MKNITNFYFVNRLSFWCKSFTPDPRNRIILISSYENFQTNYKRDPTFTLACYHISRTIGSLLLDGSDNRLLVFCSRACSFCLNGALGHWTLRMEMSLLDGAVNGNCTVSRRTHWGAVRIVVGNVFW